MATPLFDATRLFSDALYASAVDFDWSEGYGETWESVTPDFSGLSDEDKREYLNGNGGEEKAASAESDYKASLCDLIAETAGEDGAEPDGIDGWNLAQLVEHCEANDIDINEAEHEYSDALADACRELAEDNPDVWSPMMSYYYPIPRYKGDAGKDQVKLDQHCSCVLAEVNGETVLALAGGGMDLSADICMAFCLLGYLPPLEYACASGFYRGEGKRKPELIAACRRSWDVVKGWAEQGMADFDRIASQGD